MLLLNEEKTELLQMAAQDLRGLLTGMQLVIDSAVRLRRDSEDPGIGNARYRGEPDDALLSDLLEVEALEGGRREFRIAAVDPVPLIRGSLAIFAPAAARKTIGIGAQGLELDSVAVHANPTALRQTADNLRPNAIEFSPGRTCRWPHQSSSLKRRKAREESLRPAQQRTGRTMIQSSAGSEESVVCNGRARCAAVGDDGSWGEYFR